MPNYLGRTGQGVAIVLPGGAVGRMRSIQLPEWTMERVDATSIENNNGFMNYVSGDLADPGQIVAEVIFDPALATPLMGGCGGTTTVTFPLTLCRETPNSTPATLSGTGFVTVLGFPNMAVNELMILTVTISFDGETGPAFTAES